MQSAIMDVKPVKDFMNINPSNLFGFCLLEVIVYEWRVH